MAVIETSISINQPVEKVFEYITDVVKQKDLNPMINEVVLEGAMAGGSRSSACARSSPPTGSARPATTSSGSTAWMR